MSAARKNSYPREFKLKVLEYYFKNGGEQKFGLKSKTAQHFCIDHKTVSRMLCNPDIVKKARRALSRKQPTPSCKTDKPNLRDLGEEVEAMEIDNTEVPTEELPSHKSVRNLTPEKHNVPPLPIGKAKVPATKCKQEKRQQSAEVSVIELPEDPDYSLLKQTIQSSASGAANIAKLLLTGTKEVKQIITNECELIFECKVCRNLFRSVVNFLAHKRVYCEEEYTNVKSIFHKDTGLEMTSQSNTVVVEPEPPPEDISPLNNKFKVDNIATQLANKKQKNGAYMQELSSSTNTGSSQYFEKLAEVNEARKDVSKDCSVKLQDIVGVTTAVYQTFVPPNEDCPDLGMQDMLRELEEKKKDTAHLDEEGNIVMETRERIPLRTRSSSCLVENITTPEQEIVNCSTCGISFPTQKLLDSHISDVHGIERTVYTCPICNMAFLSIWGCVKHLIRIHKKKKHQRERLKHVICSRSYKKNFTTKEMSKHNHRSYPQEKKKSKEECSDKEEEEPYPKEIYLPPEGISRIVPTNVEENVISPRKKSSRSCAQIRWECNVCRRRFLSHPTSLAHLATHLVCDVEPQVIKVIDAENTLVEDTPLPEPKEDTPLPQPNSQKNKASNQKQSVDSEYARLIEESFAKEECSSVLVKEENCSSSDVTDPKQHECKHLLESSNLESNAESEKVIKNEPSDILCKIGEESEKLQFNQRSDLNCSLRKVRKRKTSPLLQKKKEKVDDSKVIDDKPVNCKFLEDLDGQAFSSVKVLEAGSCSSFSNSFSESKFKKEEDRIIKMVVFDSSECKSVPLRSNSCVFLRNVEYEEKFNSNIDFLFDRTWLKNKKIKKTYDNSESNGNLTILPLKKKTPFIYKAQNEFKKLEKETKNACSIVGDSNDAFFSDLKISDAKGESSLSPETSCLLKFEEQHMTEVQISHSLPSCTSNIPDKEICTNSVVIENPAFKSIIIENEPVVDDCSSKKEIISKTKSENVPIKDNSIINKPCKFISNVSVFGGSLVNSKDECRKSENMSPSEDNSLSKLVDENKLVECSEVNDICFKPFTEKEVAAHSKGSVPSTLEDSFHGKSQSLKIKKDNIPEFDSGSSILKKKFSKCNSDTLSLPVNVTIKEVSKKISKSFKIRSKKCISPPKLDYLKKENLKYTNKGDKIKKSNSMASSSKKFLKVFRNSMKRKDKKTIKIESLCNFDLVGNEYVNVDPTIHSVQKESNCLFNSHPSTSSPSTSKKVNSYNINCLETLEHDSGSEDITINTIDLQPSVSFGRLSFDENIHLPIDPMDVEGEIVEISSGITLDGDRYLSQGTNFGKVCYDWEQL